MSINVQFTILNKKKTNFIELKKEVNFIELMFLKHQKEVKLVKFFPTGDHTLPTRGEKFGGG